MPYCQHQKHFVRYYGYFGGDIFEWLTTDSFKAQGFFKVNDYMLYFMNDFM